MRGILYPLPGPRTRERITPKYSSAANSHRPRRCREIVPHFGRSKEQQLLSLSPFTMERRICLYIPPFSYCGYKEVEVAYI